ncbi:MAG: gamma-glutamyl-gamma-aminobutyrate hydrolase [Thermodesulfovibrio sp.]|nr:gamma-glutamyl-gamma-aminobutyrate hydrolase [Thermodesulfovibrio sp.]
MPVSDFSFPLIGITCGDSHRPLRLQKLYGEAVLRAGGRPEYLYSDSCPTVPAAMMDGLLIPGGGDIHPQQYGEAVISQLRLEDAGRTAFELDLLKTVLEYNRPVLGICYGMQLINVYLGGSLYQDIRSLLPQGLDHCAGRHDVSVRTNPYLPVGTWTVNSSHHQAVRNLGAGLVSMAFSPDGISEAFYGDRPGFLLGVQWHPERLSDHLSELLFERFVSACRHL